MRLNAARACAPRNTDRPSRLPATGQFLRPHNEPNPSTCPISCSTTSSNVPCASSKATSAESKNITPCSAVSAGPSEARRRLREGVQGHRSDANLATEAAKLRALQVQQQLGNQTLNIANQRAQTILTLFK